MAQLQIVYLLRPGTQERWRRLCQELAGPRLDQLEASCRQAEITQVQVRLVQLLRSELLLITVQTQEPHQTLETLVSSERRFDHWLREQLQVLLGWNMQEVLPDPQGDLIFTWPGECECDDWWAEAESTRASSPPEVEDDDVP